MLKEISPEYPLEPLMLKLQYFGHVIQRTDSLEKTLVLGKIEGRRRRGQQRMSSGLPWCLSGKESACQCRRRRFDPLVRKIPWRRKWQPTPVFLPGEFHAQRSQVGYSSCGHKRSGYDLVIKQQQPGKRLRERKRVRLF